MIKDYRIEDNQCVVCGDESFNMPLCPSCYKSYKRFYNSNENLIYCNKTLRYSMLKLFAYFDILENEEIDDDKTSFLIDFSLHIRPLIQKQENFGLSEKDLHELNLESENQNLKQEIQQLKEELQQIKNKNNIDELTDPRKKWPSKYRCKDGHYVRSRAELLIDNWLYSESIIHIYEKQVTFPNGEKRLCDFYLPDFNAFIEFWGMNDDYYLQRKNDKIVLYKSLKDVKLIQLDDKSLENLDDILEDYINQIR